MGKLTKDEALAKIEELKKYVDDLDKKETETVGVAIMSTFGEVIYQSTKSTIREAVSEAHERGADLSGADLSGANLRGVNLRCADLSEADLSKANLRDADLYGADLCNTDLYRANLRNTNLSCAKFSGCDDLTLLKRSQLPDFLAALGFLIEEDE